jgi:hypothetical protein
MMDRASGVGLKGAVIPHLVHDDNATEVAHASRCLRQVLVENSLQDGQ